MNMDATQANQLLKFLDEERQRDKALVTKLQEQIDAQANQLSRQEERLQAMQGAIGRVEAIA